MCSFLFKDACCRLENDSNSCPVADVPLIDEDPLLDVIPECARDEKCEKATQRPSFPDKSYKNQSERRKRELRAELIDTVKEAALKNVHFNHADVPEFVTDVTRSKKWHSTFGVSDSSSNDSTAQTTSASSNPTLQYLVKEYKESLNKEKSRAIMKKSASQKAKVFIGCSLKDSKITLSGEKTPEEFKDRVTAAVSIGRITCYADERRRLLSIVAMDYSYRFLQEQFGCSPNTVTAARVHCILFGRGGTPPSKFKFSRQCVSPAVLEELSEFFMRDDVSRPSSCRSVMVNKEETPVRYWKDNIKNLVDQYLMEFPGGVKRTYIYSHLPPNFRTNTMLAGLCNLCDDYGHSNYEKMECLLSDVQQVTAVSMKEAKAKVFKNQQYMKTQFRKQALRHSPCLELCMSHAFGSCSEPHPSICSDATGLLEVEKYVKEIMPGITDASDQKRVKEELEDVMSTHVQYASHLLRTKHQGDYYKFILDNLQPGDAVVVVDYKMKLELGVRLREIQRDWYGKRGISLHGFLVVAQVEEDKKVSEVIDLWSEDTKQDAWFSQSAMDVCFRWMEQAFPGYNVYLFSGKPLFFRYCLIRFTTWNMKSGLAVFLVKII